MIFRIRNNRQLLRQYTGLNYLLAQRYTFTFLSLLRGYLMGHVIIFRLRNYQIRILRQILRQNTGLICLLAQG